MHRITLLAVFWLTAHLSAALSPVNAQQTGDMSGVPPLIAEAATAYLAECESFDASPVPTDRFITRINLNDDGRSDYIIDTSEINASCFCGSGGCTIEAWVSDRESYVKAFQSNVRAWQVSPKSRLPTVLIVDLHGTACGGVGADMCLKALTYESGKFIDTTAE